MKSYKERLEIAAEMIRRADTAAILNNQEVYDIRKRALAGEFDTIFDDESASVIQNCSTTNIPGNS